MAITSVGPSLPSGNVLPLASQGVFSFLASVTPVHVAAGLVLLGTCYYLMRYPSSGNDGMLGGGSNSSTSKGATDQSYLSPEITQEANETSSKTGVGKRSASRPSSQKGEGQFSIKGGLGVIGNKGGGDCFFYSVINQLNQYRDFKYRLDDFWKLRNDLANHAEGGTRGLSWEIGLIGKAGEPEISRVDAIKMIRTPGEWNSRVGDVFCDLMAHMLGRWIHVHQIDGQETRSLYRADPCIRRPKSPLHLFYSESKDGEGNVVGHYESIVLDRDKPKKFQ